MKNKTQKPKSYWPNYVMLACAFLMLYKGSAVGFLFLLGLAIGIVRELFSHEHAPTAVIHWSATAVLSLGMLVWYFVFK